MSDKRVKARLICHGLVQNVGFRLAMHKVCEGQGVNGWVQNRGQRVEALIEGPELAVQRVINWCHEGPTMARVDGVDVTYGVEGEVPEGFVIR